MNAGRQGYRSALPVIPTERLGEAFKFLSTIPTRKVPVTKELKPAEAFPACSPPEVRTPPHFVLPYRRALLTASIDTFFEEFSYPRLGCVGVEEPAVYFAYDLRFEQTWNLKHLGIGDLSSIMSLAPSERLTLEFLNTQRRLLEQTTLDSAEELTSTESITIDKSIINVARSSTQTQNWHVDGSGSFSLGSMLGINIGGGGGGSETQSAQNSVQHITEATNKSAHSLKALHKIEVRGVTEEFIQNRMTRVIKNPYPDRALSLNVFQLIKHFSVQTALAEIWPSLIIEVNHFLFNAGDGWQTDEGKAFVIANAEFLRESLIDQSLIDELPIAIQAAKPVPSTGALKEAQGIARLALDYLYKEPNIFNVSPIEKNDPAESFNASREGSGLGDAIGGGDERRGDTGIIFTTLNFFYKIYGFMSHVVVGNETELDKNAIALATTVADGVKAKWETVQSDAKVTSFMLDNDQFTEVFRRLSGFLALVSGMLQPLLTAAAAEKNTETERAVANFALNRLLAHLKCHENYYIQQFLSYAARKTSNQAIVDFVNQIIAHVTPSDVSSSIYQGYDIQRSFVDGQKIVVPGFQALEDNQITRMDEILSGASTSQAFSYDQIKPTVEEIEVPADGIHLEVAGGACILEDLPAQVENSIEFSIHNACLSAHVSGGRGTVPSRSREYVVQPGDTLSEIAQHFNTTVDAIVRLNNIEDPNRIFPNQVLLIPTSSSDRDA